MKKVLISLTLAILLFTGCKDKKIDTSEVKVLKHLSDKIDLHYTIIDNKNLIIEVENKGEKFDYATLDLAIYDKEDKLLGVEKQYLHSLDKNQKNVLKITFNEVSEKENVSKIDITVKTGKYDLSIEKNLSDKIESNIEKGKANGYFDLELKNNSGTLINNLNASVVFYKDKKIVDLYSVSSQNIEGSKTEQVYIPLKKNSSDYISYDDIKVFINYAISY